MQETERISKELLVEDASIWFTEQLNDLCILIKAPTNTCKSLIKECGAEIIIGKDNTLIKPIIHIGIKIFDDKINPLLLTGAHRFREENKALIKILKSESCLVGLYNELGVLVSRCQVVFNSDTQQILEFIGGLETLYFGDFTGEVIDSLDSFDYTIDNTRQFKNPYLIDLMTINCEFKNWNHVDAHFAGVIEQPQTRIDDLEEGATLEKYVWFSIESLFPFNIYLNPRFKNSKGDKELTDILAFYDSGIFLIETKGLSVFAQTKEKSMEKKVTTLKKHIKKAITQLIGATENIERGTQFFDSKGKKIELNKNIVPHCIVLVSELLPFGDWENIQKEILIAMCESKIFLNVLDFREFMTLVKNTKGKKEYLDYYLIQRTKKFVEYKNIHLRTIVTGQNRLEDQEP
ncbi:nuclease-related domain-containing protein [Cecembia rubra]|uniref:Uncharacterized protein n=1 Tax=Cecembia rubra TaxID=1485585 RepID=A0A2P8DM37_9BACT|nr:nuclease-related domain-containing protein [Cecembia rubra]PSK98313.1 hypothetical protein CLV48_11912 [Cecembia rubra]